MATKRPSFEKRQRDQAKRLKAAQKREKRQNKGKDDEEELEASEEESTEPEDPRAHLSEQEIIERLDALHKRFDDEKISFEDFEEQRDSLLALLQK